MKVLVTGAAGYIGSHTCLELLQAGYSVVAIDNLSNSNYKSLKRIQKISKLSLNFFQTDILEKDKIKQIIKSEKPEHVIHFAGLKAVEDSVRNPIEYYNVNVTGVISLLQAMESGNCKKIIYSSSATVYGNPKYLPYDENHPKNPTSPYGRTKAFAEEIIRDWVNCEKNRKAVCLRYFNPVGAHKSGQIGEDPLGIPNNLMPIISQVAIGKRDNLQIYGNNYNTNDGTCLRDYVHVVDIAKAHLQSLENFKFLNFFEILNLGCGKGISVMELMKEFEKISGKTINYEFVNRRVGDLEKFWANPALAEKKLGWRSTLDLTDMCSDTWRWQRNYPKGY